MAKQKHDSRVKKRLQAHVRKLRDRERQQSHFDMFGFHPTGRRIITLAERIENEKLEEQRRQFELQRQRDVPWYLRSSYLDGS